MVSDPPNSLYFKKERQDLRSQTLLPQSYGPKKTLERTDHLPVEEEHRSLPERRHTQITGEENSYVQYNEITGGDIGVKWC